MNLNLVIIQGRLAAKPTIKQLKGKFLVNLTVATSMGDGPTEWHKVVAWRKSDTPYKNYDKADQILVEGRVQTRKYEDKKGVEQYTTEILASRISRID